jgi:hypothetical protein
MSCCGGHLGFAIHTHNANFVKEDPAIIQFQINQWLNDLKEFFPLGFYA